MSNNGAVTTVLKKHIDGNLVIQVILQNDGHFANNVQTKVAMAQTNPSVTQPGPDYVYAASSNNPMMSLAEFRSRKRTVPPVKIGETKLCLERTKN